MRSRGRGKTQTDYLTAPSVRPTKTSVVTQERRALLPVLLGNIIRAVRGTTFSC